MNRTGHSEPNKVFFLIILLFILLFTIGYLPRRNTYKIADVNAFLQRSNVEETNFNIIEHLSNQFKIVNKSTGRSRSRNSLPSTIYILHLEGYDVNFSTSTTIPKALYNELEIGQIVTLHRDVYYSKSGVRLSYEDTVEAYSSSN